MGSPEAIGQPYASKSPLLELTTAFWQVRTTWAKALTSADWGIEMRITVYAKKHWGREPTAKERARIKKRELYLSIGETEMSLALTRGDVVSSIPPFLFGFVAHDLSRKEHVDLYNAMRWVRGCFPTGYS